MDGSWNPWDLIYLSPVVIGWYIALVFYLISAEGVLSSVPAEGRAMPSRRVWLALIPCVRLRVVDRRGAVAD